MTTDYGGRGFTFVECGLSDVAAHADEASEPGRFRGMQKG
jgi:hypothetical protein